MINARTVILWSPRVLALLTALFLSAFALDAFGESRGFASSLPHFILHLTPALVLLAVIALAWRRPWIGALAFLSFAALYAAITLNHRDWIAVIAGPLALVGATYLISWADHYFRRA